MQNATVSQQVGWEVAGDCLVYTYLFNWSVVNLQCCVTSKWFSYKCIHTHTHTHTYIYILLFSCSVVSDSLQLHRLQNTRLFCPSPSRRVCSNSRPLICSCHPTVSSFSSCPSTFIYIYMYIFFRFFSIIGYYKILSISPC